VLLNGGDDPGQIIFRPDIERAIGMMNETGNGQPQPLPVQVIKDTLCLQPVQESSLSLSLEEEDIGCFLRFQYG